MISAASHAYPTKACIQIMGDALMTECSKKQFSSCAVKGQRPFQSSNTGFPVTPAQIDASAIEGSGRSGVVCTIQYAIPNHRCRQPRAETCQVRFVDRTSASRHG